MTFRYQRLLIILVSLILIAGALILILTNSKKNIVFFYTPSELIESDKAINQKIRIVLRAFDHKILDLSASQIVEAAERTGAQVAGPVPLPTSIKRFCVIRSPHVFKKSREHFELRTHNRLIDILEPTSKTIDSLTRLNLPAGVDISIKL